MIRHAQGTVLAFIGIFLCLVSRTDARSCSTVGLKIENLQDGQLFYYSGAAGWQSFPTLQSITATTPHSLAFAYVVKEDSPNPGRKGVVVIKSGRAETVADQNAIAHSVQLVRNELAARFTNACAMKRHGHQQNAYFPLQGVRIPSKSYDDFHDYTGRQPPELQTLEAFHIAYEGPGGECRETDNTASGLIPSNRSQFSYNAERVRTGPQIGLATLFRTASAKSSSDGLADQRTEIRRYETSSDGTACITFQIPMSGVNYFLHVDDLDFRLGGYGLRRSEPTW
jgi:hypothetical protein